MKSGCWLKITGDDANILLKTKTGERVAVQPGEQVYVVIDEGGYVEEVFPGPLEPRR